MRKIILTTALLCAAWGTMTAQTLDCTPKPMTLERARQILPRPEFAHPIKSLIPEEEAMSVDTLDTGNPQIKIVLFGDNTWKYIKDGDLLSSQDYFTKNWSDGSPDPYGREFSSLPDRTTLWLVDDTSQFCCPYKTKVYSKFGYRHRRRHQGCDLPLKVGDPVRATFDGKVRISKYVKGYGNLVVIRHENGLETFYGHLSARKVEVNDWVTAGQTIGLGGSTGRSTGPHLHFETRYQGYAFDPEWLIDFESGTLRSGVFTLKKKYLSASSRYVPESDDEEEEILLADEEEKKAAEKKAAEEAAKKYHTIRSGDTLGALAVKYHTTVRQICAWNNITTKTTLKIGRKLRVH